MKHLIFLSITKFWKMLPFKKLHSRLISKFPRVKQKLYQDLRYQGEMKVSINERSFKLYNPGFTTIENEIFWNGIENGWEKVSLGIWRKLAIHSATILDIGANTGVYSLVASTVNKDAEVFAFEPVPRTSHIFKKNLELNPELNIKLIEKAVSNQNSMAEFYDLATESQYSASLNADMLARFENRVTYQVETLRLDSLLELNNKRVDLIKLDVEMHEPEAIEGMMELIKKNQPTILIEILNNDIAKRVDALLADLNYICFSIDEENPPKHIQGIQKSNFYNLLLIKEENLHKAGLSITSIVK